MRGVKKLGTCSVQYEMTPGVRTSRIVKEDSSKFKICAEEEERQRKQQEIRQEEEKKREQEELKRKEAHEAEVLHRLKIICETGDPSALDEFQASVEMLNRPLQSVCRSLFGAHSRMHSCVLSCV